MRSTAFRIGLTLCLGAAGCLDPELPPHVHGAIVAEAPVVPRPGEVKVWITVTNEGPGAAWVLPPCPPFVVRTMEGDPVNAGFSCLASIPVGAVRLGPGEQHVSTIEWRDSWRLAAGHYKLTTTIRAGVLATDRPVSVEVQPFSIEILP